MNNKYYIIKLEGKDWYMLYVRDYHFCLSCGPLEMVTATLEKYFNKYKSEEALLNALSEFSGSFKLEQSQFAKAEALYQSKGKEYDTYINTVYDAVMSYKPPKKKLVPKKKSLPKLQKLSK